MKQSTLLISALIFGLPTTALPLIGAQPDLKGIEEDYHDDRANSKLTLFKRSFTPPIKSFQRAQLPSKKTLARPVTQSKSTTRSRTKTPARNGNGDTNPLTEASGLLQGPGYYETLESNGLKPATGYAHSSTDHPEGKTVTSPFSAFVKSNSFVGGSRSTAEGRHTAFASVDSEGAGCITCQQPGKSAVRMQVPSGMGRVTLSVHNNDPKRGPIRVAAETDGPGETSAAAYNHGI